MTDDLDDGATFHVTRPATLPSQTTVIELDDAGINWPTLVQAAVAATGPDDFERAPLPDRLDRGAGRLLYVWARSPNEPVSDDPATTGLLDGAPWYPNPADKPTAAIDLIWRTLRRVEPSDEESDWIDLVFDAADPDELDAHNLGRDDEPDETDPFMWWPANIELCPDPTRRRTWVYLHGANGRHLATTWLDDHTEPPPTGARGKPLRTVDYTDEIAVAVESMRRSRIPGRAPPGRPPAVETVIAAMTPTERLTCACNLVEAHNIPQAAAARALHVRTDSLNRRVKRRQRRR